MNPRASDRSIESFRPFQLVNSRFIQFSWEMVPSLIGGTSINIVITGFTVVKASHILPIPLYLGVVTLLIGSTTISFFFFWTGSSIHSRSLLIFHTWKRNWVQSKAVKRKLKSVAPLCIRAHNWFILQQHTPILYFKEIFDILLNVLLSFD